MLGKASEAWGMLGNASRRLGEAWEAWGRLGECFVNASGRLGECLGVLRGNLGRLGQPASQKDAFGALFCTFMLQPASQSHHRLVLYTVGLGDSPERPKEAHRGRT